MIPFDKTIVKIGLAIVLIGMLIAFRQWDVQRSYDAGYNARKAEESDNSTEAVSATLTENGEELAKAIAEKERLRKELDEVLSRPPKTVTIYEEKVIENNPDCTRIDGFSELWNGITESYE